MRVAYLVLVWVVFATLTSAVVFVALTNKNMSIVLPLKKFRLEMGKHITSMLINNSYMLIENSKEKGKSFIVVDPYMFINLANKAGNSDLGYALSKELCDISERISTRYRDLRLRNNE